MTIKTNQSEHLINALKYCYCTKPISANLIITLSERIKENPCLLVKKLIHQVKQLPNKNTDAEIKFNHLKKALAQSFQISNKLKERLASKVGVSTNSIH